MANSINSTGTHKSQEKYTNEIVPLIRQEFNIRNDFSRDYEGDPVVGMVKVPTRNGDIKLSDYDILNGITMTQSATDYLDIPVDQEKAFSELIDGYEAETVPDNIRAQRIESAGYVVGKALEESAIDALVKGGSVSENTEPSTELNIYKNIATDIKNMKARGIKPSEMKVVVSADTELLLLTDEKFANTSGSLGAELVREGVIGKVAGVATKPNYLLPDDIEYIIYAKRWCQSIDAWKAEAEINPIQDGKHIKASALQGRMVYKDVVTNKLAVQIKKNKTSVVDPEITEVTISPVAQLKATLETDVKVADLSVTGGTEPITYTLEGSSENFKVEETQIKTKKQITDAVTESVTIKATDSKQKTKTATKEIKIEASEAV